MSQASRSERLVSSPVTVEEAAESRYQWVRLIMRSDASVLAGSAGLFVGLVVEGREEEEEADELG
jgi:hypothetical protein